MMTVAQVVRENAKCTTAQVLATKGQRWAHDEFKDEQGNKCWFEAKILKDRPTEVLMEAGGDEESPMWIERHRLSHRIS